MGSSFLNRDQLFDEVRKIWVAATPEEYVRQRVLAKMIHALHFPKEYLVIEKELKELPHIVDLSSSLPQRRIDILCYGKDIHPEYPLYPLLLIECKKETIDHRAEDQLIGYNTYVKACFIALTNRDEERFGYLDKTKMKYVFHAGLPSFKELVSWLKR